MSFSVEVGVREGCVMSPWLFNIYMDGCIREMKVGVWDLGARLNVRGVEQPVVVGLYADDTVLLADREQTINFAKPYRVGSVAILGCKIWLGKERME